MNITMDSAGRLVLPKSVRERAGLTSGVPIEVRVVDGRVELTPACAQVSVERRGGFWVASQAVQVPRLTHEEVEQVVEALRGPVPTGSGE